MINRRPFPVSSPRRTRSQGAVVVLGRNCASSKWIVERLDGTATALDTPIGYVPAADAIDTTGLNVPRTDLEAALAVHVDEWTAETPQIAEWFTIFGDKLPAGRWTELDTLKTRLHIR